VDVGFVPGTDFAPIPGSPALVIAIRTDASRVPLVIQSAPLFDPGQLRSAPNKRGLPQTNSMMAVEV
jgi:hypothetical protein